MITKGGEVICALPDAKGDGGSELIVMNPELEVSCGIGDDPWGGDEEDSQGCWTMKRGGISSLAGSSLLGRSTETAVVVWRESLWSKHCT